MAASSSRERRSAVTGSSETIDAQGEDPIEVLQRRVAVYGWGILDAVSCEDEYLSVARLFGDLRPQYDGQLAWSIKADSRFDSTYHSLNTAPLTPHTELYELPGVPNRYQALWCIRPAACGGGAMTLADVWAFAATLTPTERHHLTTHPCRFRSTPGLERLGLASSVRHPMLELAADGHLIVRFSARCMDDDGDPVVRDVILRCLSFFDQTQARIRLAAGQVVVWDNHRMLHARTAFQDRRRELCRLFID